MDAGEIGKSLYPVKRWATDYRGTVVTFQPDASIFQATEYNFDTLSARPRNWPT